MRILRTSVMLAAMLIPAVAWAQEIEFKGTGWVNTKELSLERLKGKVVVLYFFEEG